MFLFLSYISAGFILIPLIIGLKRYKYLERQNFIILSLLIVSLLTEIISLILIMYFKKSNIVLYNSYILIETVLLYFYFKHIQSSSIRRISTVFLIIFILTSIYELAISKIQSMNAVSFTLQSIYSIVFSLLAFQQMLREQKYNNILQAPVFWINSAILLFFTGNLFLHLFSQYLQEHALNAFFELWAFHSFFNIVFYTLISIGFWKIKTSQT